MGINAFEQELRKIVSPSYPDAAYVGRACYVRLSEVNRAKVQFISTYIANQYDALRLTILNRDEGAVDNLVLRFSDLLGKSTPATPISEMGSSPTSGTTAGE